MRCKVVTRAIYDYTAQTEEELSIKEGDILLITDDTDQDWWTAIEKPADTFQEARSGLVPVTYVEEMLPVATVKALYDYDPANDDEVLLREGDLIRVYEKQDANWWFIKRDNEVGLAPSSYLSDVSPKLDVIDVDPVEQKNKLLNALGGFGFSKPTKEYGPDSDYIPAFDKKKKRDCLLCVDNDIFYITDSSRVILSKFPFDKITKFKEKKSKLVVETDAESLEFEGDRNDFLQLVSAVGKPNSRKPSIVAPIEPSPVAQSSSSVTSSSIQAPKVAVALYDYDACEPGELSIKENDRLFVLDDSDPDWTLVRLVSKKNFEGLVPRSYIDIQKPIDPDSIPKTLSNPEPLVVAKPPLIPEPFVVKQTIPPAFNLKPVITDTKEESNVVPAQAVAGSTLSKSNTLIKSNDHLPRGDSANSVTNSIKNARSFEQIPPPLPLRKESLNDSYQPSKSNIQPVLVNKEKESATSPPVPARPPEIRPPVPARPAEVVSPPILPNRNVKKEEKPINDVKISKEMPDPSKLRVWRDKTGSFQVDAAFISFSDNKVQLHKSNGVKISVPIEKLDSSSIDFVKQATGMSGINLSSALPAPPKEKIGPAVFQNNQEYTFNGFDWRDWFIQAGVASSDASEYAKKFVSQRIDLMILLDMERETLRSMSITEGDIIRIRKAASVAQMERKSEQRNLDVIGKLKPRPSHESNIDTERRTSHASVNAAALQQAGNILRGKNETTNDPWAVSTNSLSDQHNPFPVQFSSSNSSLNQKEETQKTLAAAQQNIIRAQEQAKQAALLNEQTRMMQQQAALARAQESARQAMLLQQQTEQALMNAQRQAAIARPLQAPLIPTPSNQMMNQPQRLAVNQQPFVPHPTFTNYPVNSGDKYSAFKDVNPSGPSVFDQSNNNALNNAPMYNNNIQYNSQPYPQPLFAQPPAYSSSMRPPMNPPQNFITNPPSYGNTGNTQMYNGQPLTQQQLYLMQQRQQNQQYNGGYK